MVECPYDGCKYATGWTHRGGEHNHLLEPPEGDFFEVSGSGREGAAYRWDDNLTGIRHMKVFGCPKCFRMFISGGQVYLD